MFISFVSLFFISYKHADKYGNYEKFWINAFFDCPEYYVTNQNLSKINLSKGNFEQAKYYMEKAMTLKSSFKTFIDYAEFLIMTGQLEEAEEALLKMEKDINGHKDLLYFPLSEIYYQKKDYEKALDYALKAYNMKNYDINYCLQLIKIYDIIGNYNEELKIYEALQKFNEKSKKYENKIMELKEKISNKETNNA